MNTLKINVANINREIKNTKKYLKYCDEKNCTIKYNNTNDYWLKKIEKAINIKNIEKRYSYIYDTVCEYLDSKYIDDNLCNFDENGICDYFRNEELNHKNGCCYSESRGGLCEHLNKNSCSIKAISCKLYACPLLRKKKININMKDIPLIKYFFSFKQKYYIKYSFFKPKPYVMYKLMECYNEKNKK